MAGVIRVSNGSSVMAAMLTRRGRLEIPNIEGDLRTDERTWRADVDLGTEDDLDLDADLCLGAGLRVVVGAGRGASWSEESSTTSDTCSTGAGFRKENHPKSRFDHSVV